MAVPAPAVVRQRTNPRTAPVARTSWQNTAVENTELSSGVPTGLGAAAESLAAFLHHTSLTDALASLERRLEGADTAQVRQAAVEARVSAELLIAALTVRESLGRINDLIHAAGIMLALPHVLEDGETITNRPSLGAGNDSSRPYDLETNQRVAEFKLARWRGSDAMRKRQTFKDLVMLAADRSDRTAALFVIGPEPGRFLRTSTSTAAWALDRSPGALRTFETAFGSPQMAIAEFTATHARHVQITDLRDVLPSAVAAMLG